VAEYRSLRQRILVVEDDLEALGFYRQVLEASGFRTCQARSGREALSAFTEFKPDLVLLDLKLLGEMDGFEVLSALRTRSTVRVIILSKEQSGGGIVRGLNLGADNYLVKPISAEELVARVRAQVRRTPGGNLAAERTWKLYCYGELVIDLGRGQALRRGKHFTFGDVERRILERLLQSPGQMVSYAELMEAGWGSVQPLLLGDDARPLLNVAYRLRRKLRQTEGQSVIETVNNAGFIIAEPDQIRD
jgi:DNA-binding response OmpR family regulator